MHDHIVYVCVCLKVEKCRIICLWAQLNDYFTVASFLPLSRSLSFSLHLSFSLCARPAGKIKVGLMIMQIPNNHIQPYTATNLCHHIASTLKLSPCNFLKQSKTLPQKLLKKWKNQAEDTHKTQQQRQQQQQHNKNLVSSLKWWVLFAVYEQFVLSYCIIMISKYTHKWERCSGEGGTGNRGLSKSSYIWYVHT